MSKVLIETCHVEVVGAFRYSKVAVALKALEADGTVPGWHVVVS